MKMKMFAIHDSKAEAFNVPFSLPNEALAVREFTALVNSPDSQIGQFPEDYTLFEVGEYDTQSGKIESTVLSLGNGRQYIRNEINEVQDQ